MAARLVVRGAGRGRRVVALAGGATTGRGRHADRLAGARAVAGDATMGRGRLVARADVAAAVAVAVAAVAVAAEVGASRTRLSTLSRYGCRCLASRVL